MSSRSTGPRTLSGKEQSRMNALRHGLTSKQIVLPGEDTAAYEETRAAFFDEYQPVTSERTRALERMVDADWRLSRARRVHTAFVSQRIAEIQKSNPEMDHDIAH